MFLKYSDLNTIVYTVSKVHGCKEYTLEHLKKINVDILNAVHDEGFNNHIHELCIFNDDLLATLVGLTDTPGFEKLAKLEETVESVHREIPGHISTEGHMWVLEKDKSAAYEKYVWENPQHIMSRPRYIFLNRPVSGCVSRFDGSDVCRTAFFNYHLKTEDGVELMRYLRDTIDEDWPGARNVVFSIRAC